MAIIGKQNVSKFVLFNDLVGVRQSSSLQCCIYNVGHHIMFKPECSNKLNSHVLQGNRAIIVDEPGVTRDRLYGRSYWGDQEFMVIDTGGVITLSKSQAGVMEELAVTTTVGMDGIPLATREAAIARMPSMIEKQAVAAVDEAAVVLFVVDGQAGLFNFFFVLGSANLNSYDFEAQFLHHCPF